MLRRKLQALNHPNPESVQVEDEQEYRSIVVWLEDQKIRHYKIEERELLRQTNDPNWQTTYEMYQKDLSSPVIQASLNEQLNWLVSFAIRLEYADNVAKYNAAKVKTEKKSAAPSVVSTNPLDNIDFTNDSFKAGVERMSNLSYIGPHPDPRVRVSALAKILKSGPHPSLPPNMANVVKDHSDVFRLLFLSDLRSLQTSINEALVAVQTITADPRTDSKLGKVGYL